VTDTATRTPTESPTPTTADRISESAVPLSTAAPGEDVADLQPSGDTLASAKVVGLGEATHGTREFFQLKHRILRYLVVEQGVRTFAWESGFAMSRALDDYVRRGAGDAKTALSTGGYGVWQTEAVLAMVEWLGSYLASAEPTLPEQVRSDLDRFAENPLVLTGDTEQLQRGLTVRFSPDSSILPVES
jgi:erythromycin esterase